MEKFGSICSGFHGNPPYHITYPACIENLLNLTRILGAECHSRFIFYILTSTSSHQTLDQSVSDEHGETFHKNITKMENKYQGNWNPSIMGNLCWLFLYDIPETKYTRSSKKTNFWLCGTMNCVIIQVYLFNHSFIYHLSCFISYKQLQLLK